jgi:sugar lactone lactonase YvrE
VIDMFVCSGTAGKSPWRIHRIDASSKATLFAEIAEGLLLNGFTPFFGHSALVADSYLGAVFQIDLVDGSANTWFQHSELGKSSDRAAVPGVNGIKCFEQGVYVTNTDSARLIKIEVGSGGEAKTPTIVEYNLIGDDFAFDRGGNIYVATHSGNSVLRLSPTGRRSIIGRAEQGLAGSTACAFERRMRTVRVFTSPRPAVLCRL